MSVFFHKILLRNKKKHFFLFSLFFSFLSKLNFFSLIFSLQVTKRRRIVARVQCRNIKNECPKLDCDEPVQLPGKCCKACPGKTNGKNLIIFLSLYCWCANAFSDKRLQNKIKLPELWYCLFLSLMLFSLAIRAPWSCSIFFSLFLWNLKWYNCICIGMQMLLIQFPKFIVSIWRLI